MTTRYFWWIVAVDQGKTFLVFGSDRGEAEARQKALELLGGTDFDIKKLPTRDQGRASSLLKGNRLEQYHSLHKASQKLGHDRSLKRACGKARAKKVSWATNQYE